MKRCLIFFMTLISAQLFIFSTGYADQYRSLTMEFGADRLGGDYKSFEMNTNDPLWCQVSCAQDNKCKAYTFVPAGILTFESRGPVGRCYLKSTANKPTQYKGLISGMKLP
ncbi:MAG: hypothetical protein D3911_15105 [Candidatus Electrothrix sp. AW3_4]|nr:hypothetical protein [Candidatus Electrothrix gigas]